MLWMTRGDLCSHPILFKLSSTAPDLISDSD